MMDKQRGQKVAISGAFSSGKTTLFNRLTLLFPQLVPHVELATMAKSLCPTIDWWRDDVRGYLRWAQILAERNIDAAGGTGLFDGSYADAVAHERAFNSMLQAVPSESDPLPYDLTLVCDPADVAVEINGIRESDDELRTRIHKFILEEVDQRSHRVVTLSGSIEQRVAAASAEIKRLLANVHMEAG
jgi:nicotinamide riboside kinase